MGSGDTHGLGYERVDDDPNVAILLATMQATSGWQATHRLRLWERAQLFLRKGERLLDVGCGLGDAAFALVDDLGDHGEIVGVDLSAEMVRVARAQFRTASCQARFSVGDACALDEADNAFDVVRSERTLQWLADPVRAVAEMARVVRPGGLVSLIDTDWSSFAIDIGDVELAVRVRDAMRIERGRPSNIGSRLREVVCCAGLQPVATTAETQHWASWNPDESPAPDGCFSMSSLADDLVEADQLAKQDRERFVSAIHDAARRDQFSMTLTMHAVVARSD